MYEDADFVTEKLTACIYAALRWPVCDPPTDNASLAAAWAENQGMVSSIIQMSLYKYEQAVVERTIGLQPEEQEHSKKKFERERLERQRAKAYEEKVRRLERQKAKNQLSRGSGRDVAQ